MRKLVGVLILLFCSALIACSHFAYSRPLPPYPVVRESAAARTVRDDRAEKLFRYARQENRRLKWDECLAAKARYRAREMVHKSYFSHKDPRTGKNSAWKLIAACRSFRCAGENLARGNVSAFELHEALMSSSGHRKNIQDPRYSRLGIGCYEDVCVQLFAGF